MDEDLDFSSMIIKFTLTYTKLLFHILQATYISTKLIREKPQLLFHTLQVHPSLFRIS